MHDIPDDGDAQDGPPASIRRDSRDDLACPCVTPSVTQASNEFLARLEAAASASPKAGRSNIARQAADAAVRAAQPARIAPRVTAAIWPPMAVPAVAATFDSSAVALITQAHSISPATPELQGSPSPVIIGAFEPAPASAPQVPIELAQSDLQATERSAVPQVQSGAVQLPEIGSETAPAVDESNKEARTPPQPATVELPETELQQGAPALPAEPQPSATPIATEPPPRVLPIPQEPLAASPFALRPGDAFGQIRLGPAGRPIAANEVESEQGAIAEERARSSVPASTQESPPRALISQLQPSPPLQPHSPLSSSPPPALPRGPTAQSSTATLHAAAMAPPADARASRAAPPLRSGPAPASRDHRAHVEPARPGFLRRTVRLLVMLLAGWLVLMISLVILFRFVDPPGSPLMAWQWLTGTQIRHEWVPLERISPNLRRAVIVSEDGRFCDHWGIDPREVVAAIKQSRDGVPRGASTITMQVAKNMFLWNSKSYFRKALEVPLTFSLELFWPKQRILEVYLNIAEWGPGIFGAEAAARYHFGKPVASLSRQEAALLAVSLPNPILRDAGDPGIGTSRLAQAIERRMSGSGRSAACVLPSRQAR